MIGCGKMGSALLKGWLLAGLRDVTIVDPVLSEAPAGAQLAGSIGALSGKRFDTIIIAIKPQMVTDILPLYRTKLAPNGAFLSIVAGISLSRLKTLTQADTVRAMPNLPALLGQGVTALCTADAKKAHIDQFKDLFSSNGQVVLVKTEDDIDKFTAVAGSGPAYVFEFMRAYINAAQDLGFDPETAETLIKQTVVGSALMAADTNVPMATLRGNVTSKNGTTQAGLEKLMADDELASRLTATLNAAYQRAKELAVT